MTEELKLLTFGLLRGDCYLLPRPDTKGNQKWMLYKGNQKPVRYFSNATVRKIKVYLRKNAKEHFVLNLSLVRQAHGKTYIKKLYKNLKTTI